MLTAAPVRVAVLCSARAPGLRHLLSRASRKSDYWQIVCCVSSEHAFEHEAEVLAHGVPVIHHPRAQGKLDPVTREAYDSETVQLLQTYAPDIVVLAGYLLILSGPMLNAYADRIINVHHSDLSLRDSKGGPRYAGLRAVRDAILAGETETRSSAHVVTAKLDDGPVLLRSQSYPVPEVARWARAEGEDDVLRRVIWAHQEWMLRSAFGPLMEQAIERVALLECAR